MFVELLLIPVAFAVVGVDVSSYTDVFTCLKNEGYQFAIVRGYCSYGAVDPNVVANIKNARAAGFQYVDVYLFPCVSCGNPVGQASALVDALEGQNYGTIWVDIENYRWSSSFSANQEFILSMTNELTNRGQTVGIYTSYYNWQDIVGVNWSGVSEYPLWYAHYDNIPSFSDFSPFGGWLKPAIKQYRGDVTVCGAGVDLNWYP